MKVYGHRCVGPEKKCIRLSYRFCFNVRRGHVELEGLVMTIILISVHYLYIISDLLRCMTTMLHNYDQSIITSEISIRGRSTLDL
jgi:hypothetical protein